MRPTTTATTTTTFAHVEWFTRHGNAHAALTQERENCVIIAYFPTNLRKTCDVVGPVEAAPKAAAKKFHFSIFHFLFFPFLFFLGSAGALSRRPLALYKALRIWGPRKIAINSINIALQFEIYSFIDWVQAAQHINSILMCTTFLFIPRIWPQLRSLLGMRISCESLGHSLYNEVMQHLFYIMHHFKNYYSHYINY